MHSANACHPLINYSRSINKLVTWSEQIRPIWNESGHCVLKLHPSLLHACRIIRVKLERIKMISTLCNESTGPGLLPHPTSIGMPRVNIGIIDPRPQRVRTTATVKRKKDKIVSFRGSRPPLFWPKTISRKWTELADKWSGASILVVRW